MGDLTAAAAARRGIHGGLSWHTELHTEEYHAKKAVVGQRDPEAWRPVLILHSATQESYAAL